MHFISWWKLEIEPSSHGEHIVDFVRTCAHSVYADAEPGLPAGRTAYLWRVVTSAEPEILLCMASAIFILTLKILLKN